MKVKSHVIKQVQSPQLYLGMTRLGLALTGLFAALPFPVLSAMDLQFLILFASLGSVVGFGSFFMRKSRQDWHWESQIFVSREYFPSKGKRQLIAGLPPQ